MSRIVARSIPLPVMTSSNVRSVSASDNSYDGSSVPLGASGHCTVFQRVSSGTSRPRLMC